ncbi:type VI secretion system protein TssA [Cupriavidus sp. AU9028]|uniref:type VI secretion system protein TssA n=1 Tax=Cupriavidus sp. AU9028 TaxID=2871157 RepID=UPI001C979305|nr:type VI secretion system protein TssA [Cupriavidus sp. AU9028]MBY4897544.1 type VI secretion system protein TssA [Cupriavidus sp. AU9028]
MATLPFDRLLQPIAGADPCGEDLLFSAEFDRIQEARRFDDPSLDQGEWVTELKEADWRLVVELSSQLLAERTKDLRLAVWLTEALARTRGFAGLADGYTLCARLCESFWDRLHPRADDDDLEVRTGSVAWLAARSRALIREIPLVDETAGGYGYVDWEVATALTEAIRRDPDHADELSQGKVTQDAFEAARKATAAGVHAGLLQDVVGCQQALSRLADVLDARAGDDSPTFRQAREALEAVRALLERFVGKPLGGAGQQKEGDAMGHAAMMKTAVAAVPAESAAVGGGPIRNRQQALAQLREVADFFRRTEPHSPVAYLAARAAKWGEMPLHAWLRTVVKDDATLSQIEELLGVMPDTEGSD